jgi:hypothetical protein
VASKTHSNGWPDHVGTSYPGGYKIEDEIIEPQGKGKLIYLQKTRFRDDGRVEYRFTYYVIARKGRVRGHWVFGRNSLFLPETELARLLARAREKEWKGFA